MLICYILLGGTLALDTSLIAAIIGAATTITAPIITLVIKNVLDTKHFTGLSVDRQKALAGYWSFNIDEVADPDILEPVHSKGSIELSVGKKLITGRVAFSVGDIDIVCQMKGGFIEPPYLEFRIRDVSKTVIRYANLLCEMSPDSSQLSGKFSGFYPEQKRFIFGLFEATKVAAKDEVFVNT